MAKFNFKNISKRVMNGGAAALGGGAGLALNKVIPASINPKMRSVIKILGGAIIPELAPKMNILESAGLGMCGQAGGELAGQMIPSLGGAGVEGIGKNDAEYVIDEDFQRVHGVDDVVSGTEDDEVLSGVEDTVQGTEDEVSGSEDELSGTDDEY